MQKHLIQKKSVRIVNTDVGNIKRHLKSVLFIIIIIIIY